ncbi:putative beta-lactamase class C protein [Listeria floridensis FSL S10-1187]|uniref:Beta-lactamase class C protein n=1 Tax=Listeria floridensis FSL S10-1187 TaxID=1265817 RepID=A0ABP3AZD9_9LIST|nr:serine hydrolase domain-containing protein [Listeria floridensis]EUJ32940.1 putative beta-lactamase class C protein [Listeria floridensis FSL S10-1187]
MFQDTKKLLHRLVEQQHVPGVSYAILTEEQQESDSFGLKTWQPEETPLVKSDSHIYDIASLTKVIGTATRLVQLHEQNLFEWSDPVARYLPDFNYPEITLLDLVTHSSGLQKNIPGFPIEQPEDVRRYVFSAEPVCPRNEVVEYSDINFLLLGYIIEELEDQPFETQIRANILLPLEMNSSSFYAANPAYTIPIELTEKRGLINGIVHDHKAYIALGNTGHAGLFAPLSDLMKYAHALLFQDGAPLFQSHSLAALSHNYTKNLNRDRGIGFDLRKSSDHYALYHTGFTGTFIVLDTEKKAGLIVLTNRIHPTRNNQPFLEAREHIVDTFIAEIYKK